MANNGETQLEITIGSDKVVGVASFHKTLKHNCYGEVDKTQFDELVAATKGTAAFGAVGVGPLAMNPTIVGEKIAPFINPQAGLAFDRLTQHPSTFDMPPSPKVRSDTTAAEMTEIYWMSQLRDVPFDQFATHADIAAAATEINAKFAMVIGADGAHLRPGIDVPGKPGVFAGVTAQNLFRLGLPGEEVGPLVSQFFVRDIAFGTQTINQRERPYKKGRNYLTQFKGWLHAQNTGNGEDGVAYSRANELKEEYYEGTDKLRFISTMRDLARFVNKDALHQAYFNAALQLMNGEAKWNPGNPYGDKGALHGRETGFGTLGGPHILALVSEVATRALEVVWNQKWQVHLRLRPEAYAGLVHVQNIGVVCKETDAKPTKRAYGLPQWVADTQIAGKVRVANKECGEETLLLPMAFTPGSPTHPSYGAGHATVAGACVTVLKAYFQTFYRQEGTGKIVVVPLSGTKEQNKAVGSLIKRANPYDAPEPFEAYITGTDNCGFGTRKTIPAAGLTLEGELNKLAMNVAMGRTMGGVHWRTDNTRSLILGEAMAAQILANITIDVAENAYFEFRSFARNPNGEPKIILIQQGRITVDGVLLNAGSSVSAL